MAQGLHNPEVAVSVLDRETAKKIKSERDNYTLFDSYGILTYHNLIELLEERKANYRLEFTITARPLLRDLGVEISNNKFEDILKDLKKYCNKRHLGLYAVLEYHKPYDSTAFLHSHGIISLNETPSRKMNYDDFMSKTSALSKWLYRKGLKFNWSRIISLHLKYPIKEGNLDRKIGSFKNWCHYINDFNKEGNRLKEYGTIQNYLKSKRKKFLIQYCNSVFLDWL